MAVIGKIRQRSGLIIGFIALSLLAFILSDAMSNNPFIGRGDTSIGEMGGKKIDSRDFDEKYRIYEENARKQYGDLSPEMQGMLRDQVWEAFFRDNVLKKEYKKLNISVSPEELTWVEFKSPTVHPVIERTFTDPQTGAPVEQYMNPATGQIDLNKVLGLRQSFEAGSEQEQQWIDFVDKQIIDDIENKKYFNYVSKGNYVTTLEAKEDFLAMNNNLKGQAINLNYFTIPDSSITVTDAELSEYLQKHPEQFEQEASRKLEYVVFDVGASAADTAATLQWAVTKAEDFKKTTNDSLFVVNNGGFYDTSYKIRIAVADAIGDSLFAAEAGTVIGPVVKNGGYSVFKIMGAKQDTVSFHRGAQILLRPQGIARQDTLDLRKKAGDILAEIRSGKKTFEQAVVEHSVDPVTNQKGGDLGWMEKKNPVLPKNLVDAVVNGRKGDYTIVTTGQGVHIVSITHFPTSKAIKFAEISKPIEPGNETSREISDRANEFAGSVTTAEQFEQAAQKMNLSKRFAEKVSQNDRTLAGINDARNVVLWAFNDERKVGDVSEPYDVASGTKIIVARLVTLREKGTAKVDDVREKLTEAVRKEKKAQQLKQKYEEAMKGATTLQQIADKLKVGVQEIPYQTFNAANVTSVGPEPALLGYLFGSEKKKISGPVKGENGVFVFWVESIDEVKVPEKLDEAKQRLMAQGQGSAEMAANEALRKVADIKDYRYKFY